MPFLNLDYSLLIYEDNTNAQPKQKLPDFAKSIQGVTVSHDKSDRITLYPNEIKDIAVTTRPVQWDSTTGLSFEKPIATEDNVRIRWTGVGQNPVFRTKRAIGGDSTTTVTISRVSGATARITVTAGTAWSLAPVAVNDLIKFEKSTDTITSPFSEANQGKEFLIQAKGANYIDFLDNGVISLDAGIVLGTNFEYVVRVMSQGPVRSGDTIDISGAGINPSNVGEFTISSLSYDYVQIVNPFAISETILYGSNSLNIYDHLIGFLHLRGTGKFKFRANEQTQWMRVDPLLSEPYAAIFIGSISAYKIQALNDGQDPIEISVQHAMVGS